MSFVLGFGKSEQDAEQEIEKRIRDEVESRHDMYGDYFSGDFARSIGVWVDDLAKESREVANGYRHAEDHPARYSSFWAATLNDANHLVFILNFHHINRKHALAPDGWAMFQSDRVFYIRHGDG